MDVYTLVATLGRCEGDGLPEHATGGGMMLYAPGRDEKEAVNDAARLLKQAGLNVLELGSEGAEAERGDISEEERELIAQARAENSVVVVQTEVFYEGS